MKNLQKIMLRGKVEGEIVLLSEGTSVKESPEDKQASVPCSKEVTTFQGGSLWHSTPGSLKRLATTNLESYPATTPM